MVEPSRGTLARDTERPASPQASPTALAPPPSSSQSPSGRQRRRQQWFAASAAALGWLALALQMAPQWMGVSNAAMPPGIVESLTQSLRRAGDFAIWSNVLTVLLLTHAALPDFPRRLVPGPGAGIMAIAASYAAMTTAGYHFLLHDLNRASGVQLLADNLLYYIIPLLFLMYWWLFVAPLSSPPQEQSRKRWRRTVAWSALPIVYLTFVLATAAYPAAYSDRFNGISAPYAGQPLRLAMLFLGGCGVAAAAVLLLDRRKR